MGLGYRIVEHDVQLGHLQVDLIAHDPGDDVYVFVEVKTRVRGTPDFPAANNLRWDQRKALLTAARRWLGARNLDVGYRLDLVCVEAEQVVQHVRQVGFSVD